MSLRTYYAKRRFDRTSEPRGAGRGTKRASARSLIFVVQKHDASHLHYDFRLEMGGVLKSWAVPKGPSLNPADKRLAVEVEDHPYDYKDFEGEIPKGNYGAGDVIVWDTGLYSPAPPTNDHEKEALRQYTKGHLTLVLLGKKIKGEFGLILTKRQDTSAGKRQWLLIKADDKYASKEDVTTKKQSAVSRKRLK